MEAGKIEVVSYLRKKIRKWKWKTKKTNKEGEETSCREDRKIEDEASLEERKGI